MTPEIYGRVVRAVGDTATESCEFVKDSISSPVFTEARIQLSDVRFSEERGVTGRLVVSGRVTSGLCDLLHDEAGMIREVHVYANGEFLKRLPTQVTKRVANESFIRPFPMIATFEADLGEVNLSSGNNWFELQATDPIPEYGLTGFVGFRTTILAERDSASSERAADRDSPPPLPVPDDDLWKFSFAEPSIAARSTGSEIHAYYVRLAGSREVLDAMARQPGARVAVGPDGHFYLGDNQNGPEPSLLGILGIKNPIDGLADEESDTFEIGYLRGLVLAGANFFCGKLRVDFRSGGSGRGAHAEVTLSDDRLPGQRGTLTLERGCGLPANIADCSATIQAFHHYVHAVNHQDWPILFSVARGDWEPFGKLSKELVCVGLYGLELMEELHQEYGREKPGLCGMMQGRLCLEIFTRVAAQPKVGISSKVQVLSQLKDVEFFREPKHRSLLDKVIELLRSSPFALH